jgi:hypothetical protein
VGGRSRHNVKVFERGNYRRLYSMEVMEAEYSVREGCGLKEVEMGQEINTGPTNP